MNLDAVMTEVAARLDTIAGLRVSDHPVDTVNPPHAIVALPEVTFDLTYGRGCDRYALPVVLAIGKSVDRSARANLAPYVAGGGEKSFKAVLEDDATPYTSCDSLTVQTVEFEVITWSSVEYLAATFLLDIIGDGEA